MAERGFEFCVFDPEGDYVDLENAIVIGDAKTTPSIEEAQKLIEKASVNLAVNTQAIAVGERPSFFMDLLPHITTLRSRTGRPHWLLIDEAHHLLPSQEDVLRCFRRCSRGPSSSLSTPNWFLSTSSELLGT